MVKEDIIYVIIYPTGKEGPHYVGPARAYGGRTLLRCNRVARILVDLTLDGGAVRYSVSDAHLLFGIVTIGTGVVTYIDTNSS